MIWADGGVVAVVVVEMDLVRESPTPTPKVVPPTMKAARGADAAQRGKTATPPV